MPLSNRVDGFNPRIKSVLALAVGCGLSLILSSCSGSSSAPPTLARLPSTPSASNSTITLGTTASTASLLTAGGYATLATFPAVASAAVIDVSSSTQAPEGVNVTSFGRHPESGTLSQFFYVNFTPRTTITLPVIPSFSLYLPTTFAPGGKVFYYAISQPAPAGVYAQYRTEGPGKVDGSTVSFGSTAQPLTLTAGTRYTFTFYALSSNNVSAAKLLFVTNAQSNSITAYPLTARGNIAPIRTIAGVNTGISNPMALTSDGDGNLIVANVVNGKTVVETFASGTNGNATPLRAFTVSGAADYIAVDPLDASIYLSMSDAIRIFSPTGTHLRTISQFNFDGAPPGYEGYYMYGLAIDNADRLIVGGDVTSKNGGTCQVDIFPTKAGAGTRYSYTIGLNGSLPPHSPVCQYLAYASTPDHVFTIVGADGGNALFEFRNSPNGELVEYGDLPNSINPTSLVADSLGMQTFVGDTGANAILPMIGNGSSITAGIEIAGPDTGLSGPTAMTIALP